MEYSLFKPIYVWYSMEYSLFKPIYVWYSMEYSLFNPFYVWYSMEEWERVQTMLDTLFSSNGSQLEAKGE